MSSPTLNHQDYYKQLVLAQQFIEEHDNFLVVSHISPDGDAASSTFAMGWMLKQLNKSFTMINEGKIPDKFDYLWGKDQVIDYSATTVNASYKYVISVDCADFERIGKVKELFSGDVMLLNIDHHPTNDYFGAVNLIKDDAAATAELLYDLCENLQIPWQEDLAVCIYTGLMTDTGGFRYSNTTPKVMQIAAKLLQYGVNGHQLAEDLLEKLTLSHILLLKIALSSLTFSLNHKVGWICVTNADIEKTQASHEDLEGLVNYPRNIEGIEVGLLFKEVDKTTVKVSFRSAGRVDVSLIAKELGGGGHMRASGCTVEGSMDQVIPQVLSLIERVL
ncbi:MAG TPA: bifunctional oligoribonuclease/PAP phosphatase NrnA [Bacilli bacterium]